jgi:gluconate 2-dehydrogenase gamma chain
VYGADSRLLDALTARIFPGDPTDPGAREIGAVAYIERLLDNADEPLRALYRTGLAALDRRCREAHGCGFADADAGTQDALLTVLAGEVDGALRGEPPGLPVEAGARLFAVACEHTLQGVLGDPAYGGNRDAAGWRLIGFPGVQWGYRPEHMRDGFDARAIPIRTLAEIDRARRAYEHIDQ